jgi:hypothetical protein
MVCYISDTSLQTSLTTFPFLVGEGGAMAIASEMARPDARQARPSLKSCSFAEWTREAQDDSDRAQRPITIDGCRDAAIRS